MTENYDVVIIGGGIVGNTLAAHLASERNKKLRICVVSSTDTGMPASEAAAGLLTPFQLNELENPALKEFCLKSFEYFPQFLETITSSSSIKNIDLGYRQSGSLYLIFSNLEFAQKEAEMKDLKTIEPKASFLSKADIIRHEPLITKELIGAYHYPSESYINNPKFLKAVYLYCLERNVDYLNTTVQKLEIKNDCIESVVLDNGQSLSANKVVLCNGVWANSLLKQIYNSKEALVKAIKGEIIQVACHNKPLLQKIVFCSEGYLVPRPATNQFESDSILIGSTSEEVELEKTENPFSNTISGTSSLMNLFKTLLPSYKEYSISNYWAGLRPQTKDKLPIIGKITGVENLYCSLGHYRNGILMSPLSGKLLTDLILDNYEDSTLKHFQFERLLKFQNKENFNGLLIPQN